MIYIVSTRKCTILLAGKLSGLENVDENKIHADPAGYSL